MPISFALVAACGLAYLWLVNDDMRQFRVLYSVIAVGGAAVLTLFWALLFSGWSWKARLGLAAAVILPVVLFLALFRIEEFSGDFVPSFAWRSSPKADTTLPSLPAESPDAAATTSEDSAENSTAAASDWPRFLGATIDGVVVRPDDALPLSTGWQARPPKALWRQPIGAGWGSFAVVGERAWTLEQRGDEELVVCYAWKTGEAQWSHSDEARYATVIAGVGPRSTPTWDGGRLYCTGGTGILNCIDADTGRVHWSTDIWADTDSQTIEWGTSCSPLVVGDLVYAIGGKHGGPTMVAYRKLTGEIAWRSGDQKADYASPVLESLAGVPQIIALHDAKLAAYDPADGRVLWDHPWPGTFPKCSQPTQLDGDRVLLSSGYDVGAELIRVEKSGDDWQVKSLWKNRSLRSKFAHALVFGEMLIGLDDGIMVCIDIASGERLWKGGRYGHGQMLRVGDRVLVLSEKGDIAWVEPNAEAHRELTRFHVLDGKTWNNPVLIDRWLLVRNGREAACYELPVESTASPD